VLSSAPLCGPPRYNLRHLEMASPSVGPDIEAQINALTEAQPAHIANPPPTTNTANPQLPTSADPQPHASNTNQHHNGNGPAQQTTDNSEIQRGMLTFPFRNL